MRLANLWILFFTWLMLDCAPTRFVEPLKKGQKAMGINFGGPLIHFSGATIPIPFSAIYGGYGYSDAITLYGGAHLTAAVYKDAQWDLGASFRLSQQSGYIPALGANTGLNLITAIPSGVTRIFPQFDLHAHWNYAQRWKSYIGASSWLDFYKANRQSKTTYQKAVFNFYIGQSFKLSESKQFTLEYKLLAPKIPNDKTVVDYVHWSDKGAQGIYLGFQYLF